MCHGRICFFFYHISYKTKLLMNIVYIDENEKLYLKGAIH